MLKWWRKILKENEWTTWIKSVYWLESPVTTAAAEPIKPKDQTMPPEPKQKKNEMKKETRGEYIQRKRNPITSPAASIPSFSLVCFSFFFEHIFVCVCVWSLFLHIYFRRQIARILLSLCQYLYRPSVALKVFFWVFWRFLLELSSCLPLMAPHTHTHTHTQRKMAAEQAPGHLRWIRRVIDRDLLISGLSGDAPDPEESGFINIIAFFFLKPKKKVCFSLVMDLLFRFCRRCGIS